MRDGQRLLLIGLGVIALFCWGWVASAFWNYRQLTAEVQRLQTQQDEFNQKITEAKRLSRLYEELTQDLGKPLPSFEPGKMTAKLMEQVQGALTQSKLKVETLQPAAWQVVNDLRCVRMGVQVTAVTTQATLTEGLQSLIELLMRLRSLQPPMVMERLNLQTVAQPQPSLRLQAQIFWMVPVEEAALKKLVPSSRPSQRRTTVRTMRGEGQ